MNIFIQDYFNFIQNVGLILAERINITIQRVDAASLLGTVGNDAEE